MVIGKTKERVYAFIDSQNLNLGVRNDFKKGKKIVYKGWNLDFRKFFVYLRENLKVTKAFLFIGYVAGNEDLYTNLQSSGYILVFKPTLVKGSGETQVIKGNVDAELVLQAMIEWNNYEKGVLIAGDGDYHCLVKYWSEKGKLGKIVIPNMYGYSSLFRGYTRYFKYMNDLKSKLEYQGERKRKRGIISSTGPEHALPS